MFGLFKKKSEYERLREQYERLTKEAHALSTKDRKAADFKWAEADALMQKMEDIKKKEA